jgi:DNA-binding NarL/FixJ family response regulator
MRRKSGELVTMLVAAETINLGAEPYMLALADDITERKEMEKNLQQRTVELTHKSERLEELVITLKVLLQQMNSDKSKAAEDISSNIKELVLPYLESLRAGLRSPHQQDILDAVISNLNNISSSFITRLSSRFLKLSPTELKVAGLIRTGRSTKEIAALLSTCILKYGDVLLLTSGRHF